MSPLEFDQILVPIAQQLSHRANEILDLREAATQRNDPGHCVSCYFKLLGGSQGSTQQATTPLRLWLEKHLEVVARDPNQRELQRIPVDLQSDSIGGYCDQVMRAFHENHVYHNIPAIKLSFQFKESSCIA